MLQAVQTAMNRLQPDWVGLGSDAFFEEMESLVLPGVRRLADALTQAGQVIYQKAAEQAQAEQPSGAGESASSENPASDDDVVDAEFEESN